MGWKELLKERKEKSAASDIKTFTVGDGKTRMRILPNKSNLEDAFFVDYGLHWFKSTEKNAKGANQITSVPLCLKRSYEEQCPYCDAISEALGYMAENEHLYSDEERGLIEGAKSRHRVLVNAAVRQGKGNEYKIEVVELASTAFESLINIMEEWGDEILDPETGKDIIVERSGSGINTKYTVSIPKESGAAIDESWRDEVMDLAAFVKSQQATPERHNKAIATVGKLAHLEMGDSAPAIEAPAKRIENKSPAPSKESVLDADDFDELDALEAEIDEVPVDVEDAPVAKKAQPKAQTTADDDLLAELDDLENL